MKFLLLSFMMVGMSLVLPAQESVQIIPLSLDQNPVVVIPNTAAGVTDSLQIAQQRYDTANYTTALPTALYTLEAATQGQAPDTQYEAALLIGNIFDKTNNYDKALEYYKKALDYNDEKDIPDTIEKVRQYLNIGNMFFQLQKLDSAEVYLKKILILPKEKYEIEYYKAMAYSNLSGIATERENYHLASYYAEKALEIKRGYETHLSIAYSLNNLASVYLQQAKYTLAKKKYLEALTLIEDSDDPKAHKLKEVIYDNLSWVLYKLKDYKAYTFQEKSINIRDSLRDIELSGILAEIEGKYNTEAIKKHAQLKTAEEVAKRKHAQDISIILMIISFSVVVGSWLIYRYLKLRQEKIKLLMDQSLLLQQNELDKLQNESREQILNATIDGKESERQMIAETLHNSVSTLLSSASLHLQASKMKMKNDVPAEITKAQKIINEAAEKIRGLSHSLVSSVLLKFGLKYAMQDLCEKYSNTALLFECECDHIERYDQAFELKINSIIDELLNNIIKHSKATQANISIKENESLLEIFISDNGKGFNPNKNITNSGLGLKQIEARINKMHGVFAIDSKANQGTNIFISVPIISLNTSKIEIKS